MSDPVGIFCNRHPVTEAVEVCRICGNGACRKCWTLHANRIVCLHCASVIARRRRWLFRAVLAASAVAAVMVVLAVVDLTRWGTHGPRIRQLRSELVHRPRDTKTRLTLAREYLQAHRRDRALSEYLAILAYDPYSPRAHGNAGILLYEQGDLDGAAYHLATAIDIDPTQYDTHRTLALVYERQLELHDAVESWRRAMELAPGRDERLEAGHALARDLERTGRKFEAAEVLYGLAPWIDERDARRGIAARIARLREESDAERPLLLADAVEVRFRPQGPVIPVRGLLNERVPVALIVDTGATYTTIPSKVAQELGITDLDSRPRVNFRTANGEVTSAALVQVRSLQIGDARLEDLAVAICDSCSDGLIDGLLGLNFLKRFQVEIDSTSGRLILRRSSGDLDPAQP